MIKLNKVLNIFKLATYFIKYKNFKIIIKINKIYY